MSALSKALRDEHDRRMFFMRGMSLADRVIFYLQNPREYFIDRQFRFGSAGTDYAALMDHALNRAAAQDSNFEQRVEVHVALAFHRLDAMRVQVQA